MLSSTARDLRFLRFLSGPGLSGPGLSGPGLSTLALSAGLLVCAPACSDDAGGEDGETGTEESGTEDETDTGGECLPPPDDVEDFGAQQYIQVTNSLATPVWIKGGPCGASLSSLEVDGEIWRDNTALYERCSALVEADYCPGDCSAEDATLPSIRIGAGATLFLPFDGQAFRPSPVAAACQASAVCVPPETCHVKGPVPEGASMTLGVVAHDTCSAMNCACDGDETCELADLAIHSAITGNTVSGSVTLTYPDGSNPELVLQ